MSSMMQRRRMLIASAIAGSGVDVTTVPISYTGNMTDEIVTMGDGKQYRLLTLTSSGTLTIAQPVVADIWLCGGGANGEYGCGAGGGGGFVNSALSKIISNVTAIVGGATGTSSFGDIVSANGATGPDGGSGGGAEGRGYDRYSGAGVTTYPFGDTTYFKGKPHSAGGGGGSYDRGSTENSGGFGGSNGSAGGNGRGAGANGGAGGVYGGGKGRTPYSSGYDASFYGSGGGGGYYKYGDDPEESPGGAGYQGVIYVRIPLDQRAA